MFAPSVAIVNAVLIVLGIADRGAGPAAVRGTDVDGEHLRQSIYAATKPNLLVSIQRTLLAGGDGTPFEEFLTRSVERSRRVAR